MINWSHLALDILKSNFRNLKYPYRLFLVVTKSCGSRCKYCKIWQEEIKNELNLDEYERIAKNTKWLKWLNISGGEPTDRDDLPQIISAFKKYCPNLLITNFTSNGLRPEIINQQVSQIASLRIPKFHINISIDGPPSIHDNLRGINGNFDNAIEALAMVRRIKNVESSAAMTIYPKNIEHIQETFDSIKKRIKDFSPSDMHFNLPHTSPHYYGNSEMIFSPPSEAIYKVEEFINRYPHKFSGLYVVEKIYRNLAKSYIANKKTPLPCSAVMTSVYISEKGIVHPCTIWDNPMGNLKEYDYNLKALLDNKIAINARESAESLKCPQCWTPCEAFPTILSNLVGVT